MMTVRCINCGREREGNEVRCRCGGIYKVDVDFPFQKDLRLNFPYIKKWVSLGEWNTPSVKLENITFKLDFLNPTGSYKDRGSVTLISYLSQKGITDIAEDSSGNAGASMSAYGAAAGMKVSIFVPSKSASGKLKQIQAYGAHVIKVQGDRESVSSEAERSGAYYASHVLQPEFRDGIRSLAYEIARDGGWKAPEEVYLPTSAGTLLLGVYEGFKHLINQGVIQEMPKLVAVQTEQVSPVCSKFNGVPYSPPREITSVADALVSTKPVLLDEMIKVLRETGDCVVVSENEVMEAWKYLARKGLLAEYSSAVGLAGLWKRKANDAVVVLTGNGLKVI
ncbi:pyridoxal-phosphate dependent enzyme [Metallosphaera tengchongensis]|uniref:Pyridoxal-phosphate dependent enzyme n=1 Tax=Metallosphaera tengchongensis TaxID=1532350 RepID=A0A6N0NW34_9CREN|nr:pyridoxal-phosphate dependent enzyme [Metallosphaera tengchongensis]QKR00972.1 pyridoxal-phosphate dependent enzyme [Metallosphaera tengchongensis]